MSGKKKTPTNSQNRKNVPRNISRQLVPKSLSGSLRLFARMPNAQLAIVSTENRANKSLKLCLKLPVFSSFFIDRRYSSSSLLTSATSENICFILVIVNIGVRRARRVFQAGFLRKNKLAPPIISL